MTVSIRLRSDLALLPLDNEVVAFCAHTQRLIGLNRSAAFIVRAMADGTDVDDLPRALVAGGLAPADEAVAWVAGTIEALATHGMLEGEALQHPDPAAQEGPGAAMADGDAMPPFHPVATQDYRLLGACGRIRFGHAGQIRMVNSVIGHLAVADGQAPDFVFDLVGTPWGADQVRSAVYCDGVLLDAVERLSFLGPVVKAALWHRAVNAYDFLYDFHAGVVATDAFCILFPAAPGSGKSSLTAALTKAHYRFYSDEVALVRRADFLVPPVPLAICVKDTGWDLMTRYHPNLALRPIHRRADGKVVRYVAPPPSAATQPPRPVRHIVFPRYMPNVPTVFSPVARAEALGRLMDECIALRQRLDLPGVMALIDWIAGIECHQLVFSSMDEAVACIVGMAGPASGAQHVP